MRIVGHGTVFRQVFPEVSKIRLPQSLDLESWYLIQSYLTTSSSELSPQALAQLRKAVESTKRTSGEDGEMAIFQWYCNLIRMTFRLKIAPALKAAQFNVQTISAVLSRLAMGLKRYMDCFDVLGLNSKTYDIRATFQALVREHLNEELMLSIVESYLVDYAARSDAAIIALFNDIVSVGLSDIYYKALQSALTGIVRICVTNNYTKVWHSSVYEDAITSNSEALLHLISMTIGLSSAMKIQVENITRMALLELRISEIFDIVKDYPESSPALDDMRLCLQILRDETPSLSELAKSTYLRSHLVRTFQKALSTRLLHPGVSTSQILMIYISTIRSFLKIDPLGVLLNKVAWPIRQYASTRDDTIRCITASLLAATLSASEESKTIDDEEDQQIGKSNSVWKDSEDVIDICLDDDDFQEADGENTIFWSPNPIDAPAETFYGLRSNSITSALLSIYSSRHLFLNELQHLLSQRLLSVTDYNIDLEISRLELLKVRFSKIDRIEGRTDLDKGGTNSGLSAIDVMVKDIGDSQRTNKLIHEFMESPGLMEPEYEHCLHASILSRLYWPNLERSKFELPEGSILDASFTAYARKFERFKPNRKIAFNHSLGQVRVLLSLTDRELDVMVTPIQAAFISLFAEQDTSQQTTHSTFLSFSGELCEAAQILRTSDLEIQKVASFWQSQQVIAAREITRSETATTSPQIKQQFYVLEELPRGVSEVIPSSIPPVEVLMTEEGDADHPGEAYWTFIVAMLTNVGALPVDRIASMLSMFAPGYSMPKEQLIDFLDECLRDERLEKKGVNYMLLADTAS